MGLQTPPGSAPWRGQGTTAAGLGEGRALQWGGGLPQYNPHQETSMDRAETGATPGSTGEICHWFLGSFLADGREYSSVEVSELS